MRPSGRLGQGAGAFMTATGAPPRLAWLQLAAQAAKHIPRRRTHGQNDYGSLPHVILLAKP